jgi:hypothetical protein
MTRKEKMGEAVPVFYYPDGRRVVGWPGSRQWIATGGRS